MRMVEDQTKAVTFTACPHCGAVGKDAHKVTCPRFVAKPVQP